MKPQPDEREFQQELEEAFGGDFEAVSTELVNPLRAG